MDDLILFIAEAVGVMMAVLSLVGVIALLGTMGFILYLEFRGADQAKEQEEQQ